MLEESYTTMATNTTIAATLPTTTEPVYWPDFGPLQYLEVVYLTIITVLGTIGNLIVIFSIALERRVHLHGNAFIINLAVADLIVSSIIVPTVIANVVKTGNALGEVFCDTIGFLVTVTCTCSLCNLMFIAINRYWAVVRSGTYQKMFSRKRVYYMIAFTWIWSALVISPTLMGWGGLRFDAKMMVCSWDDIKDKSYTYFITVVAIFIPMIIIAFCYFKLFRTVRGSGRWVRSLSVGSGISSNSEQHRRSMKKEQSLLRTLLTTVLLFCCCWMPFGGCVIIDPVGTPAHAKKIFGWLALTNSCVNFIIYGAMNPVFRRGYHNLFIFVFRCKRAQQISSAMLHGSFSDSFNRSKRATKGKQVSNGLGKNHQSRSDNNRDNSRVDTITGAPLGFSVVTQTTMPGNSPLMIRADAMQHINEPSPLSVAGGDSASAASAAPVFSSTNTSQKLEMGDDDNGSDGEEFARNQQERFSRRAMSDAPPSIERRITDLDMRRQNSSFSNAPMKNLEEIAKGPLRGNWVPEKTVYRSKNNTPVLGRSQTQKPLANSNGAAIPHSSPTKDPTKITTISGEVEKKTGQTGLNPDSIFVKESRTTQDSSAPANGNDISFSDEHVTDKASQAPHELSVQPLGNEKSPVVRDAPQQDVSAGLISELVMQDDTGER